MNLRSAATTALAIVVALTLAMGEASAADHEASRAVTRHSVLTSGSGTAAAGAGDEDFLTGYPHQVHTDERMIEEELELAEAAPHTLWHSPGFIRWPVGGEHVSHSPHGGGGLKTEGGVDFPSQVADVDLHDVLAALERRVPDVVQDLGL
jgi:hypothetical protein